MKNIFIIMLLVLIPLNVQATNNQKTLSGNQLCRYYKEEKVFTDYIIEGENTSEYPFKSNDKITKEYQTTIKPVEKPNRIITESTSSGYGKIKKVNRLVIRFEGEPLLYQLEIYEKDDDLDFTYSNYNTKTYPSIQDDDLEHFEKISTNILDIILPYEVDPFDITIKLYMDKENEFTMFSYFYPSEMTKRYEEGNPFYENYYIKNINEVLLENMVFDDEGRIAMKKITISLDDVKTYRYEGNLITNKELINDSAYYKVSTTNYTYQDTLFKYYKIQRQYKDGYYTFLEGYIKDESKCINKYQQQSNIIATNKIINNNLNNKIETKQEEIVQKEVIQEQEESIINEETLENDEEIDINKINNLSYKESKIKTKINKIIYILPVIILSIIFLLGYLLYNLLKER